MYFMGVYGVRFFYLGKKIVGNGLVVGYVYYVLFIVNYKLEYLLFKVKGLVFWIMEG